MSSEIPAATIGSKFRRDLDREAVSLALKGEWERAAEVNRLVKALIELGSYEEASAVLDNVCRIAPSNNIARKNRARLEQMRGSAVTIRIQEISRHRSLQHAASFPTRAAPPVETRRDDGNADRLTADEEAADEEEEEGVIDEDELQAAWSENE